MGKWRINAKHYCFYEIESSMIVLFIINIEIILQRIDNSIISN